MDYKVIEDPSSWIGNKVHVSGWNPAAVFILTGYYNGRAFLKTRVGQKEYETKNDLLYLRKNQ